jgi:hypothetical protein
LISLPFGPCTAVRPIMCPQNPLDQVHINPGAGEFTQLLHHPREGSTINGSTFSHSPPGSPQPMRGMGTLAPNCWAGTPNSLNTPKTRHPEWAARRRVNFLPLRPPSAKNNLPKPESDPHSQWT